MQRTRGHRLLDAYLDRPEVNVSGFARALGVGRSAVYEWRRYTTPSPSLWVQIEDLTGGAVPAGAWIPGAAQ
jgi:transposase-like protein